VQLHVVPMGPRGRAGGGVWRPRAKVVKKCKADAGERAAAPPADDDVMAVSERPQDEGAGGTDEEDAGRLQPVRPRLQLHSYSTHPGGLRSRPNEASYQETVGG
jgi:hypothetical protein